MYSKCAAVQICTHTRIHPLTREGICMLYVFIYVICILGVTRYYCTLTHVFIH